MEKRPALSETCPDHNEQPFSLGGRILERKRDSWENEVKGVLGEVGIVMRVGKRV